MISVVMAMILGFGIQAKAADLKVGSKAFTEGYLLAELAAQSMEAKTSRLVIRRFGLGNTGVTYEALRNGEIDLYPEYTGTIAEAILKDPTLKDWKSLQKRLEPIGLRMSAPLGFDNTYALAVRRSFAEQHGLSTISDLKKVLGKARFAFSHEFTTRSDGVRGLQRRYGLDFGPDRDSMEHSLAYEAISTGMADVIDVYSTDSQIQRLDLVVLHDHLGYFPSYEAVFLTSHAFVEREPEAWAALEAIGRSIDEPTMRLLNAKVEADGRSYTEVVAEYLGRSELAEPVGSSISERVWRRTKEHAFLVSIAVLLAIFTGVPLGIVSARREKLGGFIVLASSLVQTIPSLALLCLLIPFMGIGTIPALFALYLYGLLPIVVNTATGLRNLDRRLIETAMALGLTSWQRTVWIEVPLASRTILAGIKTSTIIAIGTATLAALIGAGGYGAPIVSGLAMNDTSTVLVGAIPAAAMSLLVNFAFGIVARVVIPKGV